MKTRLYATALALGCAHLAGAQAMADLDAGNIRSRIGTSNYMWWDTAGGLPRCEFPKGSGKHVGFTGALWVGGYDAQAQLKVAATKYIGSDGFDFWPGPINGAGMSTPAMQAAWNRVWKVDRFNLDVFFSTQAHTAANTPAVILEWPAKGNPFARGANNAPLTITTDMAPFVDANSDGAYNALQGDYPALTGDQMVWTVFNDVGGVKTTSGSAAMGVQIALKAWAYKRNTIADDVQFYEYAVTNRGGALDSTVISVFGDLDLGFSADDHMGVDSSRRMGYLYNRMANDGSGQSGSYGANPPAAGITLLRTVGDNPLAGYYAPVGAFTYFINTIAPAEILDPVNAQQYYRYMTGTNKAGNPFTTDFTGVANVPTKGYGSGPNTRYVFNGDPAVSGTWSECYSGNAPGDRRFVLSSAAFSLPANATRTVAMALVAAQGAGGCPSVSLTGIRQAADTALKLYNNPPAYVPTPLSLPSTTGKRLALYPNPAADNLVIELDGGYSVQRVVVMDAGGRILKASGSMGTNGYTLSTAALPRGIYAIVVHTTYGSTTGTFVKE